MVSLLDVFWFLFQESYVVFYEVEFAIVQIHMPSPLLLKGITRRDICPVLTQIFIIRLEKYFNNETCYEARGFSVWIHHQTN